MAGVLSEYIGPFLREGGLMLKNYLRNPRTLERLRTGPSGPFIDDFVLHLEARGAAAKTIGNHLGALDHFCRWAADVGLERLSDLDRAKWQSLEQHAGSCHCYGRLLSSHSRFFERPIRPLSAAGSSGSRSSA